MNGLDALVGILVGAAIVACCAWSSYLIAVRITGVATTSERAAAVAVVAFWLLIGSFLVLAPFHAFRVWIVVPAWLAGTAITHHRFARSLRITDVLRADAARLLTVLRAVRRSRLRWLFLGGALIIAARLLRGVMAPPLAWDALTYHLLKAGRWVQASGQSTEAAADAWGYYEYFPYAGDILWAWAMLPLHGDGFVTLVGVLIWLACLLAAYALSRRFGADELRAAVVALTIGFTPAVLNFVSTANVDNTTLAAILLGSVFLVRPETKGDGLRILLAAGAFGIAAGTKVIALPVLLVAATAIVVSALRREDPWSMRLMLLLGCAVAAMLAVPPYLRAWLEMGSPLYPVSLAIGDTVILPGNEELRLLLGGKLFDELAIYGPTHALRALFVPSVFHRGLGPTAPLVVLLGVIGAWRLLRRRRTRVAAAVLLLSGAVIVASVFPDSALAFRTRWAGAMGRIVAPSFVAMAVLGSVVRGRLADTVWLLALVAGLVMGIPRGWSLADLQAVALLLVLLIVAFGAASFAVRWGRRHGRPWARIVLAASLVAVCVMAWGELRGTFRYRIYAAAAERRAYDQFPIHRAASSWPIWRHFDGGESYRLAVTAGWDGVGHNWFRYPLLGSRLQNHVVYVSPTADGSVVDYRRKAELEGRASFSAWVARLISGDVEYVVALPPATIEREWMERHPDIFAAVASDTKGSNHAYRFDADVAGRVASGVSHASSAVRRGE
jgi:hypothetical protein